MDHLLSALLLCVCATPIYPSTLSPSDVAQASFGSFDFKELEEILYDVEIGSLPTTAALFDSKHNIQQDTDPPSSTDETHKEPKGRRLTLISKYGQEYLCKLPEDVPEVVKDDDAKGRIRFNVSVLLQPLTKRPCLTKTTGWWTYQYCHGKFISQFHKEAGEATKTLSLGVYENETLWTEEKIDKVKNLKDSMKNNLANQQYPVSYHGVTYVNGTKCDINGKPRTAKVKIFCGIGEDKIVDIQETETCNYTIHVQSSLLCAHPFFSMKSGSKSHVLECAPIISQRYYDALEKKSALMWMFDDDGLLLDDELHPSGDDERKGSSERESFTNVLNSFLSKSGLFDSGEIEDDEDDPMFSERDTGTKRDSRDTDLEAEMLEKSTHQETDDSEEEKLALRVNKLKAAVDLLYKRMLEEFEEIEEEHPAKNLLRHAIAEISDKGSDRDIQSESDDAEVRESSLDNNQASRTHQSQDQRYSKNSRTTNTEYEKESLSQTRDEIQESKHKRLKEIDDEDSKDEEPQTVAEYLEKLKQKKTSSFLSEDLDDGDLNENELDRFEELDEESLTELEAEMNEELQRHLKEAGLDGQAQIEVKVFNLPASIIDNLDHIEDEEDGKDGTQSQRKSTSGTVKVLNVKLAGDQLFDGSKRTDFSKMLNNYLNPMSLERIKVQQLESGYNQGRFESLNEDDSDSDGEKEESPGL